MKEEVILVDANDNAIGKSEKHAAHLSGQLHRAFSVFIFDDKGRLLLQKRANSKYHSAGLWTNTCCGHPRPGEDLKGAATRRLKEEMGLNCELEEVFLFSYYAELENKMIENEIDHVFFGISNEKPIPDALEASDWKYENCKELAGQIKEQPQNFTAWFALCFDKMMETKFPKRK